jgi:hypothetical protein
MASNMAAAVSTVALFLTRAHGLLLRRRDDGLDLLPFPFMNLLDLPPLLLHRERRIRAHRLNFLPRLLGNASPLL